MGAWENGYVLRNRVIYRDTAARNQEALVIDENGSLSIAAEEEISIDQLLAEGAQQILSFGPPLLDNSGILVTEAEEVGKAKASNPRTAMGSISALHDVFVVSDGRTAQSAGLSLYELAEFMQSLGVTTAYNPDGGGSSTMYVNGEGINNPTTNVYLLLSLLCALFGAVYEILSHGVHSYYMIYAFLFPLVLGAFPFLSIFLMRIKNYPGMLSRNLYHSGIATIIVGSLIRGILEIYGTSNSLLCVYGYAGIIFLLVGIISYVLKPEKIA